VTGQGDRWRERGSSFHPGIRKKKPGGSVLNWKRVAKEEGGERKTSRRVSLRAAGEEKENNSRTIIKEKGGKREKSRDGKINRGLNALD